MAMIRRLAGALGGSGSALDLPVAALAGLSVGFAAFAAPDHLLRNLVGSARLSGLIDGAGIGPRAGIGTAGAFTVLLLVYLLLRWLDRLGTDAGETEPARRPRVRRRDAHPDAPPRSPLFAARELAEPEPAPVRPALRPRMPVWLSDAPAPAEGAVASRRPAPLEELVARLEQGLGVRRAPPEAPVPQADRNAPDAVPPAGDRLQHAIESLQRLTACR